MIKEYKNNPRKVTAGSLEKLKSNLEELGDLSGVTHEINSDEIITGNQRSTVFDINSCEIIITQEFEKPDQQGTIATGFIIWKGNHYNYRKVSWTEDQSKKACVIANTFAGIFDFINFPIFESKKLLEWDVPKNLIPKPKKQKGNISETASTADVRLIKLFYDEKSEMKIKEWLSFIKNKLKTNNNTETIIKILEIQTN